MASQADAPLIDSLLERYPSIQRALEMGPWLGGLTQSLKSIPEVHVVDTFVWTEDHDRRVPGLLRPRQSFVSVFTSFAAQQGYSPIVHQSDFADFSWNGGKLDLCLIDGPKIPSGVRTCLLAVASGLEVGSLVLIKNGKLPRLFPLMTYLQALIDEGAFSLDAASEEPKSNILVLKTEKSGPDLKAVLNSVEVDDKIIATPSSSSLGHLDAFHVGWLGHLIQQGKWAEAYSQLHDLPLSEGLKALWDSSEKAFRKSAKDAPEFDWFSVIAQRHFTDPEIALSKAKFFDNSFEDCLRAYWTYNADKPWRASEFRPDVLKQAYDFGYMHWAARVQEHVQGKSVLDVGCGPGLHGLGYLTAGAKSYVGLDPIIKLDKDRVKNLKQKSAKMPFGWTPAQLNALIGPFTVSPEAVGDLPEEGVFDIAVMHNVTEHLHQIESVFADIAKRLKPGGELLYLHHNYYAWNGHHCAPKNVAAIDLSDPGQRELIDWGHVSFDPPQEHYIARGLNRIRLDEIIALTEKYFDIEIAEERPSKPKTGLGRLTDEIRQAHPHLDDRDFETQNLFCIARVKPEAQS